MPSWRGHFFYTRVCLKTTWKLRIGAAIILIVAIAATQTWWAAGIEQGLACARELAPSDVIVIENFDPTYVLFERAAELEKAGLAPRTLVPVQAARDGNLPNPIFKGFADIMARQARLETWDVIPIREIEPISLNGAVQVRRHLEREHVKSIIVVTGGFRSRRTSLVYRRVLDGTDIQFRCEPVRTKPEGWTATWHGIQEVGEELLKLQYYRFYVLWRHSA